MTLKLGDNIKYLRKQKGLNQSELADFVKKGHTTIGNWENGLAQPSLSDIIEISNYFEISVCDLLFSDASLISKKMRTEITENASPIGKPNASLIEKNEQELPSELTKKLEDTQELNRLYEDLIKAKEEIIRLLNARVEALESKLGESGKSSMAGHRVASK